VHFWRNVSYRNKLFLSYIAIILVPTFVAGGYIYRNTVQSLERSLLQSFSQSLRQEHRRVELVLDEIERIASQISNNTTLSRFFRSRYLEESDLIDTFNNRIYPLFSWLTSTNSLIGRVMFFTANETLPDSMFIDSTSLYDEQPWFSTARDAASRDLLYWEPLHTQRDYSYNRGSGAFVYSLFFSFMIGDSLGNTYLEIEVSPSQLFGSLEAGPGSQSAAFFATDARWNVAYGARGGHEGLFADPDFTGRLAESGDLFRYSSGAADVYGLGLYIDRIDAYVAGLMPRPLIREPLARNRMVFLVLFTVSIVTIYGLSYLIANMLSKRVKKIVGAVRKIQGGDFQIQVEVGGRDEINELARDINIMSAKINDLINTVYRTEIAQKEAALNALQSQINPHFIFNTLETLKMMAEIKDEEEISEGLTSLGNLIRYHTSVAKETVPVQLELEIVEDYLNLQKLILNRQLRFERDVAKEHLELKLPNLILQPLVENSVIHGFRDKRGGYCIRLATRQANGVLHCVVRDNGSGVDREKVAAVRRQLDAGAPDASLRRPSAGIGLANVNTRLRLGYGPAYGVRFASRKGFGTVVAVKLPVLR